MDATALEQSKENFQPSRKGRVLEAAPTAAGGGDPREGRRRQFERDIAAAATDVQRSLALWLE